MKSKLLSNSKFMVSFSNFNRNYSILYVLIGLMILLSFLTDRFLSVPNIMVILRQATIVAIIASGQFLILVSGNIDLSVGSIVTLAGVVFAGAMVFFEISAVVAGILAVLVGLAIGLINGILVTKVGLPAFIATMATMTSCAGAALLLTRASPIVRLPDSIDWIGRGVLGDIHSFGIPYMVFMLIGVYIIMYIVTEKTNFGRYVFAIGGNPEAAYLSGIKTTKYKIATFVVSGVIAGFGAILLVSRLGVADPHAGSGYEFQTITACVIGGTAITGGKGKLFGVLLGAIFLTTLFNGMTLLNVNSFVQQIVQGIVLAVAVGVNTIRSKNDAKN